MSTTTCLYCGGEIIFRTREENGVSTVYPIHVSGGCWGENKYDSNSVDLKSINYSYKPGGLFCVIEVCNKCKKAVFRVKHRSGNIQIDTLLWPWTVHGCNSSKNWNIERFIRDYRHKKPERVLLGRVIHIENLRHTAHHVIVLLCSDGGEWHIRIQSAVEPFMKQGDLVVVIEEQNKLVHPGNGDYYIVEYIRFHTNLKFFLEHELKEIQHEIAETGSFKCKKCGKLFESKSAAKDHIIQEHPDDVGYDASKSLGDNYRKGLNKRLMTFIVKV